MVESLVNSILVAMLTVVGTSLLGVPIAYLNARYSFRGRGFFQNLLILPLILPPFVGALGFLRFFGRAGVFNLLTLQLMGVRLIDLQSLAGVAFVQTMHLFPIVYLNVVNALVNIDPSVEESARNLGASKGRVFRTITFPLMIPGYAAAALIVFMWSFSDLGTPLFLLGSSARLLAPQAFLLFQNIVAHAFASVISVMMLVVAFMTIIITRSYLSMRQYASVSSGLPPSFLTQGLSGVKGGLILVMLAGLTVLSLLPHIGITLGSFADLWVLSYLPERFTFDHYRQVFSVGLHYVTNTLLYSGLAAGIDIVLGFLIAYILARRPYRGNSLLDSLATVPLTVPGVVLGFGFFLMFKELLRPASPFLFTLIVLALAYSVRRLSYTVRSSHAVLQQIPESIEEASRNLGAGHAQTLRRITIPLVKNGILAGGLLAFVNAAVDLSSTVFLVNNVNYAPITLGILIYKESGVTGEGPADALGFITILVIGVAILLANKLLKGGTGTLFRLG